MNWFLHSRWAARRDPTHPFLTIGHPAHVPGEDLLLTILDRIIDLEDSNLLNNGWFGMSYLAVLLVGGGGVQLLDIGVNSLLLLGSGRDGESGQHRLDYV